MEDVITILDANMIELVFKQVLVNILRFVMMFCLLIVTELILPCVEVLS